MYNRLSPLASQKSLTWQIAALVLFAVVLFLSTFINGPFYMYTLEPYSLSCPYCGETIEVLIDCSQAEQNYIEDCQVCCRPISLDIHVSEEGEVSLQATHEND